MSIKNLPKPAKQPAKNSRTIGRLTILKSISEGQKLPKGVMSDRSLLRYVKILLSEGKIKKVGYGTWELLSGGIEELKEPAKISDSPCGLVTDYQPILREELAGSANYISENTHQVRGHRFLWKLGVLPEDWGVVLSRLGLKVESWQTGLKTGVKASRIEFNGVFLDFFKKAVVVRFPKDFDFLGGSALSVERLARDHVMATIKALEAHGLDLKVNGYYNLRLAKAEYAEVSNELAQQYKKAGKGFIMRSPDTKPWLMVDHSSGVPELETVHPKTAQRDMDEAIKPFFEDLRKDPCTLSDLKGEVKEMAEGVQVLVEVLKLQYPKRPKEGFDKSLVNYFG